MAAEREYLERWMDGDKTVFSVRRDGGIELGEEQTWEAAFKFLWVRFNRTQARQLQQQDNLVARLREMGVTSRPLQT